MKSNIKIFFVPKTGKEAECKKLTPQWACFFNENKGGAVKDLTIQKVNTFEWKGKWAILVQGVTDEDSASSTIKAFYELSESEFFNEKMGVEMKSWPHERNITRRLFDISWEISSPESDYYQNHDPNNFMEIGVGGYEMTLPGIFDERFEFNSMEDFKGLFKRDLGFLAKLPREFFEKTEHLIDLTRCGKRKSQSILLNDVLEGMNFLTKSWIKFLLKTKGIKFKIFVYERVEQFL